VFIKQYSILFYINFGEIHLFVMKRIQFIIIAFVLISCQGGKENKPILEKGWLTLEKENYIINYPETWELRQPGEFGSEFMFFSLLSNHDDQFRENISLIIQNIQNPEMDLDAFVNMSLEQVNTVVTNGEVVFSNRLLKEKNEYHSIEYTGKQGVFDLRFKQYYWVLGAKVYVLTFTGENNQFHNFKGVAEKIMNSFSVK